MWVAEAEGAPVGFVSVTRSRDADAGDGVGEVVALYVDPAHQGRSMGSALLARGVEGLIAQGCTRATLWTFAGNPRSRGFYEHEGWTLEATRRSNHDSGAAEIRYERALVSG